MLFKGGIIMIKTKTITSMFLILLMASSVFLATPTTAYTSKCSHSNCEKSTKTITEGCKQSIFLFIECNDCDWIHYFKNTKYSHDYGSKVFIGYDGDVPGSSDRRKKYSQTCKKCGDIIYSYGPWEDNPWD